MTASSASASTRGSTCSAREAGEERRKVRAELNGADGGASKRSHEVVRGVGVGYVYVYYKCVMACVLCVIV